MFRMLCLAAPLLGCLSIVAARSVDADLEEMLGKEHVFAVFNDNRDEPKPGSAGDQEAIQGKWRVLAVVQNYDDRLNDAALRDSVVDINGKGLEWKDSKGTVKFAANYVLRPAAKNSPSPAEIDGVIRTDDGSVQTLPGI